MLLLTTEKIVELKILLIAILQVLPLVDIENERLEQATLIVTLILLLSLLGKNTNVLGKKRNFLLLYLNIASIITTVILHGGSGSAVMFLNLLLASLIFNNTEISEKTYFELHAFLAIVVTAYIVTVDISRIYSTVVVDVFKNRFNSNMFAMFTLVAYFHWTCLIFECKATQWKKLVLLSVISIFAFYYILASKSRTAILSVLVFLGLTLFKKTGFSKKWFHRLTIGTLLMCCLFPVLYISLAERYTGIVFGGKGVFSGRQIIWKSAIEIIRNYPVFGNGNEIMFRDVGNHLTVSAHNMMIGIMKMFGVVPTLTILFMLVNNNSNKSLGKRERIPQYAFIATFPCVFFESIYTNSHLYMLFAFFLLEFIARGSTDC